eukprot:scaffold35780_cov61-Phaeocystis_antarctica.AAC.6
MSWPSSQTRQTLPGPPTPALELLLSVRPEIRPREELLESDVHPESVFATTCRHPVARQPHSNIAALCKRTLRSARARHINVLVKPAGSRIGVLHVMHVRTHARDAQACCTDECGLVDQASSVQH